MVIVLYNFPLRLCIKSQTNFTLPRLLLHLLRRLHLVMVFVTSSHFNWRTPLLEVKFCGAFLRDFWISASLKFVYTKITHRFDVYQTARPIPITLGFHKGEEVPTPWPPDFITWPKCLHSCLPKRYVSLIYINTVFCHKHILYSCNWVWMYIYVWKGFM